ncbi:SDR family NAD(P)-dependent oxidoreductase [Chloroflexota bacterium]
MKLENKVAIITGGGRGIGRAFALRFAKEGAKVVLTQRTTTEIEKTASEVKDLGGQALPITMDLQKPEEINEMVQKAVSEFGGIDILVNNAAFYSGVGHKRWDDWSLDEWTRSWDINVVGAWLCAKAAVPHMKERGKGKIVNISSVTFQMGYQGHLPYTCSKAATVALTRGMARALGRYKINANCIAVGYTMSEASAEMPGRDVEGDKILVAKRSIRREQLPEDLEGTALYLASEDSDMISGQTIVVDGGDFML